MTMTMITRSQNTRHQSMRPLNTRNQRTMDTPPSSHHTRNQDMTILNHNTQEEWLLSLQLVATSVKLQSQPAIRAALFQSIQSQHALRDAHSQHTHNQHALRAALNQHIHNLPAPRDAHSQLTPHHVVNPLATSHQSATNTELRSSTITRQLTSMTTPLHHSMTTIPLNHTPM